LLLEKKNGHWLSGCALKQRSITIAMQTFPLTPLPSLHFWGRCEEERHPYDREEHPVSPAVTFPRRKLRKMDLRAQKSLPAAPVALARPDDYQELFFSRNILKDQALANALLAGQSLEQAALSVGMDLLLAQMVRESPAFQALLGRLRKEQDIVVYDEDPDAITEALARGNVVTLQEIRDNPRAKDADRLRCALILHEMRPTIVAQKRKQDESGVRVTFSSDVMDRMQEGLRKLRPAVIETTGQEVPAAKAPLSSSGGESKEIGEE
jgi:hypothetical protein